MTKQSTSPCPIVAPPDKSDVLDGDEAGHFDFQREARINNSLEFELEVPLGDRIDVQFTEIKPIEATHARPRANLSGRVGSVPAAWAALAAQDAIHMHPDGLDAA